MSMNEKEQEIFDDLTKVANKFFRLVKFEKENVLDGYHPMDEHEWAHGIHTLQRMLMCRPERRRMVREDNLSGTSIGLLKGINADPFKEMRRDS